MWINSIVTGVGSIIIKYMTPPPAIPKEKLSLVKDLYLNKKLCVREIAQKFNVSPDAVTSFFRRHNIPRRSFSDAQKILFDKKKPSFKKRKINSLALRELSAIGTMLYWAEGYKGDETTATVDFANSDASMIKLFLLFLRKVFILDEFKFRIYLYCYSDQNIESLKSYWSKETKVPISQFSKPYIRTDFREGGRKMKYGMIHVRYHDKKLLLEIKNMIESYVSRLCVDDRVVKCSAL